jgi:hypothetical protein
MSTDVNNMPNIPPVGKNPSPAPSTSPNLPPAPTNSTPSGTGTTSTSAKPQIKSTGAVPDNSIAIENVIPVYDQATRQWTTAYVDASGAQIPVVIYADPNSNRGYSITTDTAAYRKGVIQNLIIQYGTLAKTKKALSDKGLLGASTSAKKSLSLGSAEDPYFDSAIDIIIGSNSRTNLLNGGQNLQDIGTLINGRPNYAGTKTSTSTSFTSTTSAWNDIDAFMRETIGRGATLTEYQDYYKNLHSYEQNNPTKATVTMDALGTERSRVQTQGLSANDSKALMVASVTKSLEAAGKDPSSISKLGGTLGTTYAQLNKQAIAMGVSDIYTPAKAFSAAMQVVQPGGDVKGELTKINNLAAALPKYKAFAPLLSSGAFTLTDLAQPFADKYNKVLEKSLPNDLSNPLIMQGLTGGPNGAQMNDNDFVKLLRAQPDWAKTQNAREEAASYLNQIGKLMGFVG